MVEGAQRLTVVAAEPEAGVVVEEFLVAKPAALGDVMAGGAADRVEWAAVTDWRQEFGDDQTGGRLDDVFAIGPPAEVIDFLDRFVGAGEERDVLGHPLPGLCIGDEVDDGFFIHRVEGIDVVLELVGLEEGHGL